MIGKLPELNSRNLSSNLSLAIKFLYVLGKLVLKPLFPHLYEGFG